MDVGGFANVLLRTELDPKRGRKEGKKEDAEVIPEKDEKGREKNPFDERVEVEDDANIC